MKLNRICPICDNGFGEKIIELNFINNAVNPLAEHYDVVRCDKCGFVYSDMISTQDVYNEYYKKCNMYSESESLKEHIDGDRPFYNFACDIIELYKDKDANILDVGCGGGGLLYSLRKRNFVNCCGLDPSEESIKKIINNGIDAFVGNIFDEVEISRQNKYDFVISSAVIEHIYDLNGYINQLKRYLKPEGYLLLDAPSVEGFEKNLTQIPNYFNQEHINFFSIMSMDNLLLKSGFSRCRKEEYIEYMGEEELCALYKLDGGKCSGNIQEDLKAIKAIKNYLSMVEKFSNEECNFFEKIIKEKLKIVVFGVGSYTMQMIADFPQIKNNILYYVDNNTTKQGTRFAEKIVVGPDELLKLDDEVIIVICSMKNGEDIYSQIKEMGIRNELHILGKI